MGMRCILLLAWTVLLSGCAIGNTYDLQSGAPTITVTSPTRILVVVQDQRSEVVSGDKQPQFIGVQRGGFGNPFDVRTTSGDPLADDVADSIIQSLTQQGVEATSIPITPGVGRQAAVDAALAQSGNKFLLIYIRQWKSDTYANVGLTYDLSAEVLGPGGDSLATNGVSAREDLGGSAFNPPAHAREVVPQAFQRALQKLLSDQKIVDALSQ